MNRGLRRPLVAVVATVVTVGAWVGAPLMAAPADRAGHAWRNPVWAHEDGSFAEW